MSDCLKSSTRSDLIAQHVLFPLVGEQKMGNLTAQARDALVFLLLDIVLLPCILVRKLLYCEFDIESLDLDEIQIWIADWLVARRSIGM